MSEVEFPDGTIVEFPDNVTPGLISTVIRRYSVPGQPLYTSVRENYGTMPSQDEYGRFNVGGSLGGKAGALDTAYDFMPWRSWDRFKEAAKVEVQPDLMGGATANIADKYGVALEATDLLGLGVDVGDAARVGRRFLKPVAAKVERNLFSDGAFKSKLNNQLGMIGSTGAKTADLDALKVAEEMKASGASADEIYSKTRWWLDHPDGRPRFEIDDSGASLVDWPELASHETAPLGSAQMNIAHDELYQNYPDMKKIDIAAQGAPGGMFSPANSDYATDGIRTHPDSVWHELQHGVQKREGLSRGGSPEMFAKDLEAYGELQSMPYESMDDFQKAMFADLKATYGDVRLPHEQYRRLAGEAEARLVQNRANLTPAERLEFPFYDDSQKAVNNIGGYFGYDVPLEDQIVRMEGGVAQSADSLAVDALAARGVKGDDLLNAQDMLDELRGVGAKIDNDGMVTVYHRTSPENAQRIKNTGIMSAKEPDIFFSTSKNSEYGTGFGDSFIEAQIPVEQLRLDDIFPGKDASVSIPARGPIGTPVKVNVTGDNLAQSADSLPIRPAKENLQTVIDSNTVGGRVVGDETVPIDSLSGGASASDRGQAAVDKIAAQMAGTDGYIERLIVDQDGNVVEGAHRLEALRKLGIKDVPVTRISDPTANINVTAMEKAIRDVGSTPSDHVNRIVADVGEMLDEVGGDPAKLLEQYEFPAGFEDKYRAALSKAQSADLPMGKGVIKPKQLGDGIPENAGVKKWRDKITETGQVKPIEVDKTGFIVDGEHRYKALMDLGVEDIPVYVGEQQGASGRLTRPYSGISVDVKIPTQKY